MRLSNQDRSIWAAHTASEMIPAIIPALRSTWLEERSVTETNLRGMSGNGFPRLLLSLRFLLLHLLYFATSWYRGIFFDGLALWGFFCYC